MNDGLCSGDGWIALKLKLGVEPGRGGMVELFDIFVLDFLGRNITETLDNTEVLLSIHSACQEYNEERSLTCLSQIINMVFS
jgi:hypothetical protein